MRRRHILIGIPLCFFATGVLPVGESKAESAALAEEHAAAGKEHATLARENADRAALAAAVAEK
jgi:hypothetical protein